MTKSQIRCFELRLGSDESGSNACTLLSNEAYVESAEDGLGHFGECLKAVIEQDDKYSKGCCGQAVGRAKHNFCPVCGRIIAARDTFDDVSKLIQSLFISSSVDTGASWEIVMQNGWDIWARDISGKDFENRRVVNEADRVIASILVDRLDVKTDDADYLDAEERKHLIEKAGK